MPAGPDRTVRRHASPRRRARPVRGPLEAGVRDVRHGGPDRQDVEPRQVLAAVDAELRGGRAGRVAGPVRAVRGGGARGPRAVLRRVRGRAAAAPRVRRGRLPADPVQHVRPHVRRRRRADRGRLLHGDLRQAVLGDRPRGHGKRRRDRWRARGIFQRPEGEDCVTK